MPLLRVAGLHVALPTEEGVVHAVNDVSLEVYPGETVGIVGESGSGKTMTALAVVRLLPRHARVTGSITFDGREVLDLGPSELRRIRGGGIGVTFQDPSTFLNPVMKIGDQIAEVVRVHQPSGKTRAAVLDMLGMVGLPDPPRLAAMYPHELSGGMRQRALMAMALAGRPRLLIADEPTTALDVTIQAQIMELLQTLQRELGLAVVLVTHDLGLVAEACQRVYVMYAGKVMEVSPVDRLFREPSHPYTQGLLKSTLGVHERRPVQAGLRGSVPSLLAPPAGCVFHPRCPHVMDICRTAPPGRTETREGQAAYCWLHEAARTSVVQQ